jgi:hypothetical protein
MEVKISFRMDENFWIKCYKTLLPVIYHSGAPLGNCDICVEQKISFMNETKRNKIWPTLKG